MGGAKEQTPRVSILTIRKVTCDGRCGQLRRALGSLKAEDKRTVEREGEQLGALESQIKDTIKGNVMLRKEVWMVHKLPGFPGHRGIPGVDGRPGRSSVIGPGGYSGPAGPPGPNGADGQSGPRGQQGEMGLQGFRGRCVPGPCALHPAPWRVRRCAGRLTVYPARGVAHMLTGLLACLLACVFAWCPAGAQTWPTRPAWFPGMAGRVRRDGGQWADGRRG